MKLEEAIEYSKIINEVIENGKRNSENYMERLCNAVAKTIVEAFENLSIEDINMFRVGYNKAVEEFRTYLKKVIPCEMPQDIWNNSVDDTCNKMLSNYSTEGRTPENIRYIKFSNYHIGLCPSCGGGVNSTFSYCCDCGQKLKWKVE